MKIYTRYVGNWNRFSPSLTHSHPQTDDGRECVYDMQCESWTLSSSFILILLSEKQIGNNCFLSGEMATSSSLWHWLCCWWKPAQRRCSIACWLPEDYCQIAEEKCIEEEKERVSGEMNDFDYLITKYNSLYSTFAMQLLGFSGSPSSLVFSFSLSLNILATFRLLHLQLALGRGFLFLMEIENVKIIFIARLGYEDKLVERRILSRK